MKPLVPSLLLASFLVFLGLPTVAAAEDGADDAAAEEDGSDEPASEEPSEGSSEESAPEAVEADPESPATTEATEPPAPAASEDVADASTEPAASESPEEPPAEEPPAEEPPAADAPEATASAPLSPVAPLAVTGRSILAWGPSEGEGGAAAAEALLAGRLSDDSEPPLETRTVSEWLGGLPFDVRGAGMGQQPCNSASGGGGLNIGEEVQRARELTDNLEYEAALARLTASIERLPCVDDYVSRAELWSLFFYAGISAFYSGERTALAENFYRAAAINPERRWDPSYPPEPQTSFLDAVQDALARPRAMLVADLRGTSFRRFAVDGEEIPTDALYTLELPPGLHVLQGLDGTWKTWVVELEEASVITALAGPGMAEQVLEGPRGPAATVVIETLQQQAGAEDLDAVWVAALPSQTVGLDPHLFQLDVADGAWREVVLVAGGEGGPTVEPVKPLLRPANYRADLTFRFRFLNLIRGVNSVNHRYIGGDLNTGLRLYQGLVLDIHIIANVGLDDIREGGTVLPEFGAGLKYRFLQSTLQPHIGAGWDLMLYLIGRLGEDGARVGAWNGFYAQGGLDIELSDKFEVSVVGGGGWNQGPFFYVNVGIGRFE